MSINVKPKQIIKDQYRHVVQGCGGNTERIIYKYTRWVP